MILSTVIKKVALSVVLACCLVGGLAYKTIRDSMYRKPYAPEQLEKIEANRDYLRRTYHTQPVHFYSKDGLRLSGLLIKRPHARRVILLCHGLAMSKEHMKRFIDLFPEDTLLVFDFRAHGQSEGDFISIGNFERYDVRAAYDFLRSHEATKNLPLIGFGVSMGGAALLGAIACQNVACDGIIIDSSFADLREQITHAFTDRTGLPKAILMPVTLALYELIGGYSIEQVVPKQFMTKVKGPVFIAHSEVDTTTPLAQARLLYDAASHPHKEMWVVKDAEHARIVHKYPREYAERIAQFLARCVSH
jgi:fermentation-respiration switch protein FrsA (DUF1100 family)